MSMQGGTLLYWLNFIQKCKVDLLLSLQLMKSIFPTLVCLWGFLNTTFLTKYYICVAWTGGLLWHTFFWQRVATENCCHAWGVFPYCLTAACSIKRIIEYPASKNHVKLCPQNLKLFSSPLAFSLSFLFLLASQTSSCLRIFKRVEK